MCILVPKENCFIKINQCENENVCSKRIRNICGSLLILSALFKQKRKNGYYLTFTALCFSCSMLVPVLGKNLEHHHTIKTFL